MAQVPGRYIAFEGPEGCGKSTHAERLGAELDAVVTREHGGTRIGQLIRGILADPGNTDLTDRAEALLIAADRAQHLEQLVEPSLAAGRHVVSDRSVFSSLAYQGYGRGLPLDTIRSINEWAIAGRWPELVILLDVSAGTARAADALGATSIGSSRPMSRLPRQGHRRVPPPRGCRSHPMGGDRRRGPARGHRGDDPRRRRAIGSGCERPGRHRDRRSRSAVGRRRRPAGGGRPARCRGRLPDPRLPLRRTGGHRQTGDGTGVRRRAARRAEGVDRGPRRPPRPRR